jgi:hypothetical protein
MADGVIVRGVEETQRALDRVADGVRPGGGELHNVLTLAAGQTHRYLMGLSRDRPPMGMVGVLPVITGRLKNSFFWRVERRGRDLAGVVATNLEYAQPVEARREFLARTVRDMEAPVNALMAQHIGRLTR